MLSLVGQVIGISVLSDLVIDYAQESRRAQKGPLTSPRCTLWNKGADPCSGRLRSRDKAKGAGRGEGIPSTKNGMSKIMATEY